MLNAVSDKFKVCDKDQRKSSGHLVPLLLNLKMFICHDLIPKWILWINFHLADVQNKYKLAKDPGG